MVQLRNELKLRQQAVTGRKFELRDQLKKALEMKQKKRIQHKACLFFQKMLFGKN
jgi:hypothetical protein